MVNYQVVKTTKVILLTCWFVVYLRYTFKWHTWYKTRWQWHNSCVSMHINTVCLIMIMLLITNLFCSLFHQLCY